MDSFGSDDTLVCADLVKYPGRPPYANITLQNSWIQSIGSVGAVADFLRSQDLGFGSLALCILRRWAYSFGSSISHGLELELPGKAFITHFTADFDTLLNPYLRPVAQQLPRLHSSTISYPTRIQNTAPAQRCWCSSKPSHPLSDIPRKRRNRQGDMEFEWRDVAKLSPDGKTKVSKGNWLFIRDEDGFSRCGFGGRKEVLNR